MSTIKNKNQNHFAKASRKLLILLLSLLIGVSAETKPKFKGKLLIIGGGSETTEILKKFISIAGAEKSKIIIFPMASSQPDTVGKEYEMDFKKFGAKAISLNISNEEANSDKILSKLKGATGIFFTGGDQTRLMSVLKNTKVEKKIKELFYSGAIISGTSAGAAVMSKTMITGNELINKDSNNIFNSISKGNVETVEGFGFIENAIIDQHFVARKRHNRLLSLILENPKLIGIGIDESTAILVNSNGTFEVLGESVVIVYDATTSKEIKVNKNGKLGTRNIKTTILIEGEIYKTRKLTLNQK